MNVLAEFILAAFIGIFALIVIGLSIALFHRAFDSPQFGGGYAIAGAILVGASLIALAIATSKGRAR
jgi:hypothetical protein